MNPADPKCFIGPLLLISGPAHRQTLIGRFNTETGPRTRNPYMLCFITFRLHQLEPYMGLLRYHQGRWSGARSKGLDLIAISASGRTGGQPHKISEIWRTQKPLSSVWFVMSGPALWQVQIGGSNIRPSKYHRTRNIYICRTFISFRLHQSKPYGSDWRQDQGRWFEGLIQRL